MKASIFYVFKSSYIATRYQFKRVFRLSRNTNKMQLCNRIYYSKVLVGKFFHSAVATASHHMGI
jgi:hypothetical protein